MRLLFSILFFALSILSVIGQTNHDKQKGDLNCIYKSKYSAKQRIQFYPFNIAETIKLISFRYHKNNYPIKKDSLIVDSLVETFTLNKIQVNILTDILYNNFYKKSSNYDVKSLCFYPRNAILFFDKSGKLREYVFICFHCENYVLSSNNFMLGDDCSQKMEKIRKFFISAGLKFGTDINIQKYEGEVDDF